MFNRNNIPSIPNPFGAQQGQPPPRGSSRSEYAPAEQQPPRYDDPRAMQRKPAAPAMGRPIMMRPAKSPDNNYTFRNLVAVSPQDIQSPDRQPVYVLVNDQFVFSALPFDGFPPGSISFSDPQRTWAQIALTDNVRVQTFDPFSAGSQVYLASMDVEVGFAGRKTTDVPYDQDELANHVIKNFENQMFAPGQQLLMDHRSIPLKLIVKTVQLADLAMEKASSAPTHSDPRARGILTRTSQMNFFKDSRTGINLKASSRRPAANAIIQPDFKFADMGIGGLDEEFTTIFRRAFASRIFPPGLVEKIGIQHVKGILLHGPPGTGKTLIARQIGKMLNAREPKVINGPEVLNKYVGQSEENIRKLFADAEKEYKETGEESGLHIIIFDELDAVCKQRGSGAGGGTGVGDSVVNQLLSKLDGVDQLNNILLIGMTNRIDMIDDALLRPGRLELHVEISLPDEKGRVQILQIHTAKMRSNNVMDDDVDLDYIAAHTKNFSGAEISGLVKAAASFAFNRHTKKGTMASVSDDVANMKINMADFNNALEEVHSAFGVSEDSLQRCVEDGILHYSPTIDSCLRQTAVDVNVVRSAPGARTTSVLLHGPPRSGKTALAAQTALSSDFPLVKVVTPYDLIGMNDMAKVQHLHKIFADAYKSPLSALLLDDIEGMIDWVPVGARFSAVVLSTLRALILHPPPKDRKLLVLATTGELSALEQLGLSRAFGSKVAVPALGSLQELGRVLELADALDGQAEREKAVSLVADAAGANGGQIGVGIKDVLMAVRRAKVQGGGADAFAGEMERVMLENRF
ncbi:hypothetical protein FH972_022944 [Carpinus fangiana]|uniref:Vesicle-fusing ATPase n=1 Tax=Carpinus fangiana TaxID=176857 RepID=A0A5N6KTR4_9ROSI|nr:hypothetical protein FH972_022944 [Carpinus fangiana]